MNIYSKTHIGLVRKNNEDSSCVHEQDGVTIVIIADGMGGHKGGAVASQMVLETVLGYLSGIPSKKIETEDVKHALILANKKVWEKAASDSSLHGMGSTATMAVLRWPAAIIGHVGDSRAYVLRSGSLTQLTKDHSYVQILIESGYITKEEAQKHPHRNIITRAIGTEHEVDVDVFSIDLEEGDLLLFCSDGLNNAITDDIIANILIENPNTAADRLVEASLDAGGADNVSVIIVITDGKPL